MFLFTLSILPTLFLITSKIFLFRLDNNYINECFIHLMFVVSVYFQYV